MPSNIKVLVSGDVEGQFSQLFKRVKSVNEKNGPFSLLLCVGEFFGTNGNDWNLIKNGNLKAPIPTYILGPNNELMKNYYSDMRGCELAENIIYLGPYGVYPCSNGLKIAYVSGQEGSDSSKSSINFGIRAIKELENSIGNKPQIDILITSEWPKGVCNYAKGPESVDASSAGSLLLARLVNKLKPRYHFAGMEGTFYERLPYRNHEILKGSTHNVTRFIALAKLGNKKKQRWLYAFNTTPASLLKSSELTSQPPDVTENPYPKDIISQTDKLYNYGQSSGKVKQFFYDMEDKSAADSNERERKRKGNQVVNSDDPKKMKPHKPGCCWFCLASPEVEKHLVVSVGTHSYLALAKGGLVPEHLLILPIEHFQSTSHLEDECRSEIEKFKSNLVKMFKKYDKTVVFFERNYKSQHLQVQVVPLPSDFGSALKETFLDVSENIGISLDEVPRHSDIAQVAPAGTPFFYLELSDGVKLFHRIRRSFPLQFGRELLACPPLLNTPERVDWRSCAMSREEETELRNRIRERFKEFDFTLDDEESD